MAEREEGRQLSRRRTTFWNDLQKQNVARVVILLGNLCALVDLLLDRDFQKL